MFPFETWPSLSPSSLLNIFPIFYLFVFSTIILLKLFTFGFLDSSRISFSSFYKTFFSFSCFSLWSACKVSVNLLELKGRSFDKLFDLIFGLKNSYPVFGSIRSCIDGYYFYFFKAWYIFVYF